MLSPYFQDESITLFSGDVIEVLATLPDTSVHRVVTSSPYWGLRDYGTARWAGGDADCSHTVARERIGQMCGGCGAQRLDRQYGHETTLDDYIERLRGVFAELRRVLVDTGTAWLNLGDCYATIPPGKTRGPMANSTLSGRRAAATMRESVRSASSSRKRTVRRKNLNGVPWQVAFALQQDGWILRNAIVWHEPNAMPESVRDRLSTRYETVFLLTKQQRYFFNLDPIREPLQRPEPLREDIVIGGAELVFGRDAVQSAITEVVDTLRSWDASQHTVMGHIPAAVSDLLLATGTARLDEITEQDIRALAEQYPPGGRRSGLLKVSRVLAHKGVIARPLNNTDPSAGHGRTPCPRCHRDGWTGRSARAHCPRTSQARAAGCSR